MLKAILSMGSPLLMSLLGLFCMNNVNSLVGDSAQDEESVEGAGARERTGHCPHEGERDWNEAGINLMGLVGRVTHQFISLKCLLHIPSWPP